MQFARRDGSEDTCAKEGFLERSLPSNVQMCSPLLLENTIKKERNAKQRGQETQHRLYHWEGENRSEMVTVNPDWKTQPVPMVSIPSRM